TAAEVNSGLTLNSSYQGHGRPSATLTVTAHDATGTPVTSAAQTITVKDPPAVTTSSGTSTSHSQAGHSNITQWFNDHPGFAHVATTLSEAGASKSSATPSVTSTS